MNNKKPKKEPELKCPGMIKKVLKDYDWLSYAELKKKVDDLYNKKTGINNVDKETFSKAINRLLSEKEISVKRNIISESELEYKPSNDNIEYFFKLTSNFNSKLSPEINVMDLLSVFKSRFTNYLFKMNTPKPEEREFSEKLLFEIESNFSSGEIVFLIDCYKCNSPKEAFDLYESITKFKIETSYADTTDRAYSLASEANFGSSKENLLKIDFQHKIYDVKKDNLNYIDKKTNGMSGHIKAIVLFYNLIFVLYYPVTFSYDKSSYLFTIYIIDIFRDYLLSNNSQNHS